MILWAVFRSYLGSSLADCILFVFWVPWLGSVAAVDFGGLVYRVFAFAFGFSTPRGFRLYLVLRGGLSADFVDFTDCISL